MHWCGGLDDLILIPLYLIMLVPGIRFLIAWVRQKLGRNKKPDCCDCHKQ